VPRRLRVSGVAGVVRSSPRNVIFTATETLLSRHRSCRTQPRTDGSNLSLSSGESHELRRPADCLPPSRPALLHFGAGSAAPIIPAMKRRHHPGFQRGVCLCIKPQGPTRIARGYPRSERSGARRSTANWDEQHGIRVVSKKRDLHTNWTQRGNLLSSVEMTEEKANGRGEQGRTVQRG
jgi:hypothetical protein